MATSNDPTFLVPGQPPADQDDSFNTDFIPNAGDAMSTTTAATPADGSQIGWGIYNFTTEEPDQAVLAFTDGPDTILEVPLDPATTSALTDALSAVRHAQHSADAPAGDLGDPVDPDIDATEQAAERLRTRFDPTRIKAWFADPAHTAQRNLYIIAAVAFAVFALMGILR